MFSTIITACVIIHVLTYPVQKIVEDIAVEQKSLVTISAKLKKKKYVPGVIILIVRILQNQ